MRIYKIAYSYKPIQDIPEDHIYVNLPSCRQQANYSCGAVALKAIAEYYGRDLEEKELMELCDSGKVKGTHPEDIVKAARKLGLNAAMKENMTLQELIKIVSQKIPVICAIQAWGEEEDYDKLNDGHYVVAIGFDNKNIYFEDPSQKGARPFLSHKDFLDRWVDREAYVDDPVKVRLGIVVKGNIPKNPEKVSDTKELP